MRRYLCQHFEWRSQLYPWLDTGPGGPPHVKSLHQLQPAHPEQLRQPEVHLHSNTLLGNGNSLLREQFKVRRIRSSILDAARGI